MLLVASLSAWLAFASLSLAMCRAAAIADAALAAEFESRIALLRRASIFN